MPCPYRLINIWGVILSNGKKVCYGRYGRYGRYVRRQGITVEVEIKEVKSNDTEPDFPFTNVFEPGTLRFFEPPIPLNRIRGVKGLENFAKGQSAFRNITHEQYRELTR